MPSRTFLTATLAVLALALAATPASAARKTGAVVFSRITAEERTYEDEKGEKITKPAEGGLFAAREGHLNQLTEDPRDSEPSFSSDGRTIAFVRDGDVYSMRADGSGERHLTRGGDLDSAPSFAPNGRYLVFERRAAPGGAADLYRVGAGGGGLKALTGGAPDDHDASFAPDGRAIVFVRSSAAGGGTADDLFSVRPSGAGLARLTRTAHVDEFEPRYFKGGIVYSRGESGEGPSAYADIYTMRRNGSRVRPLVRGAGSAYVEDVSPQGTTVLFRRDRGLWVKPTGKGRARKLTELPDGSQTNGVFSSDGRKVAAFVAAEDRESLVAIDVRTRRSADLAEGVDFEEAEAEGGTSIGPVMTWQPVPSQRR